MSSVLCVQYIQYTYMYTTTNLLLLLLLYCYTVQYAVRILQLIFENECIFILKKDKNTKYCDILIHINIV